MRGKLGGALVFCLLLTSTGCGLFQSGAREAGPASVAFKRYASVAENSSDLSRIFDRPTSAQVADIPKVRTKAVQDGFILLPRSSLMADQFLASYTGSAGAVFTLIGHNSGGVFKFPDGSWLDLRALGRNSSNPVAVISCESAAYVEGAAVGVPTQLTYDVAFATEQKFRQRIERLGIAVESLQPEQSQAELELALAEAVTELHAANMRKISLRATGVVGGSAVGVTIYQRI